MKASIEINWNSDLKYHLTSSTGIYSAIELHVTDYNSNKNKISFIRQKHQITINNDVMVIPGAQKTRY